MTDVNKKALSEILGYSERTITDWQDDGMPVAYRGDRGESNRYDTSAVIRWLVDREVAKVRKESPKDRLDRLRADQMELNLAQQRGALVNVRQLEPELMQMVGAFRTELLSMADKLKSELDAQYGTNIDSGLIAERVEAALRHCARYDLDAAAASATAEEPLPGEGAGSKAGAPYSSDRDQASNAEPIDAASDQ